MPQFSFEYPYVLLLIIVFILADKYMPLRGQSIMLPHIHILKKLSKTNSTILFILKWCTIVSLLVALASPIIQNDIIQNNKKGYNIALVLDTSASMREAGFDMQNITFDKFTIVKNIVSEFIDQRTNDNIAIVVFGSFSFVAMPLTYDKNIIKSISNNLQIGMAGDNTAIYDGLAQAVNLLSKNTEAQNSVAILLTDGRNTAGNIDPNVALKLVKKHNIKVHTIGIGYDGEYNAKALKEIANINGGIFFEASSKDTLKKVYEEINKLETSQIKSQSFIKKDYLYQYPLFVSFFSLLFFIYLRNKKGL